VSVGGPSCAKDWARGPPPPAHCDTANLHPMTSSTPLSQLGRDGQGAHGVPANLGAILAETGSTNLQPLMNTSEFHGSRKYGNRAPQGGDRIYGRRGARCLCMNRGRHDPASVPAEGQIDGTVTMRGTRDETWSPKKG